MPKKDLPTNFSGSLKGLVHIPATLASAFKSCNVFKLTATTQVAADLPTGWDRGPVPSDPAANSTASYGTATFSSEKPVAGRTDYSCAFAMTGLPLGYATTFAMSGGPTQGTSMSLSVPREAPHGWDGKIVVAAATSEDFDLLQSTVDASHSVGGGATTIVQSNAPALLQAHGIGGDPTQDALIATRALALNPRDYASLAVLASANAKLGKTAAARAQLTQAISLATSAHDSSAVAKFQSQLETIGQ